MSLIPESIPVLIFYNFFIYRNFFEYHFGPEELRDKRKLGRYLWVGGESE